jgi:hypothetical protein
VLMLVNIYVYIYIYIYIGRSAASKHKSPERTYSDVC